jgi:hypothetical protein
MTSYIHKVANEGSNEAHLIVLSPALQVSYDVVLGPGEEVRYDKLLDAGAAPVPVAENKESFDTSRIKLRIGSVWFSIYECQGTIRCVKGDTFDVKAANIAGHASFPTIKLVITNDEARADYYQIIRGSGLVVASWMTISAGVYGVGDEDNLLQKYWNGSGWQPWQDLKKPPAGLAGPVAAVCWLAQRYSIFALGKDGSLYELSWLTGYWNQWQVHLAPDSPIVGVSAVSWIADQYAIFVTTKSGNIYVKYFNNGYSNWQNFGSPSGVSLAGPITAVSWSSSRYGVYALGSDGAVWQKWWAPGGYSGWEATGAPAAPVTIKSLSSVYQRDRVYVIAAIGSDGNLWVHRYKHGWYDWQTYKQPKTTALNGVVAAGGDFGVIEYDYLALGTDGAMYMYSDIDSQWRVADGS